MNQAKKIGSFWQCEYLLPDERCIHQETVFAWDRNIILGRLLAVVLSERQKRSVDGDSFRSKQSQTLKLLGLRRPWPFSKRNNTCTKRFRGSQDSYSRPTSSNKSRRSSLSSPSQHLLSSLALTGSRFAGCSEWCSRAWASAFHGYGEVMMTAQAPSRLQRRESRRRRRKGRRMGRTLIVVRQIEHWFAKCHWISLQNPMSNFQMLWMFITLDSLISLEFTAFWTRCYRCA